MIFTSDLPYENEQTIRLSIHRVINGTFVWREKRKDTVLPSRIFQPGKLRNTAISSSLPFKHHWLNGVFQPATCRRCSNSKKFTLLGSMFNAPYFFQNVFSNRPKQRKPWVVHLAITFLLSVDFACEEQRAWKALRFHCTRPVIPKWVTPFTTGVMLTPSYVLNGITRTVADVYLPSLRFPGDRLYVDSPATKRHPSNGVHLFKEMGLKEICL